MFSDASELWGLSESTLRKAVAYGKIVPGVDARKYGKQWIANRDTMMREYGNPCVLEATHDVTIVLPQGWTGLVGNNGSGKTTLAQGMLDSPELIVMDEPTNYLDLVSTVALERLLSEYPVALLLVSHDFSLIDSATSIKWSIQQLHGNFELVV